MTPDLHVALVKDNHQLLHTIRYDSDGSWSGWGDVEVQTGPMGDLVDVAVAAVGTDLHLAAVNTAGDVWHTVRYADMTWKTAENVRQQPGSNLGHVVKVALAAVGSDVHLAAVTKDSALYVDVYFLKHTLLRPGAPWTSAGDVEQQPTGDMGTVVDVAMTACGSEVHLAAVNSWGDLWHTPRDANGRWTKAVKVPQQLGSLLGYSLPPNSPPPKTYHAVAASSVNSMVPAIQAVDDRGRVMEFLRHGADNWAESERWHWEYMNDAPPAIPPEHQIAEWPGTTAWLGEGVYQRVATAQAGPGLHHSVGIFPYHGLVRHRINSGIWRELTGHAVAVAVAVPT